MKNYPTRPWFAPTLAFFVALMFSLSADTFAKTIRLKTANAKTVDVNVVIHGNVGLTQADAEELAEDLLEAAKLAVVDAGDGPDVLEVTLTIEADDNDDDDGIPDDKDNDNDSDGEDDGADHDEDNDGKGFHLTIEIEGGWHIDGDCAATDGVDDEIKDIMDDVIEHLKEMI
jgi:hypothetical protein